MNYIKKLQAQSAEDAAEIAAYQDMIIDMLTYLESPKFYVDPTVQKMDIVNRLQIERYRGLA